MPTGGKEDAMERWKQCEQWIGRQAHSFKLAWGILWVLVALIGVNHLAWSNWQWESKPLDPEMDRAARQQLAVCYNRINKEANQKGEDYGPKDYFQHYREIETERERLRQQYPNNRIIALEGYGPNSPFEALQQNIVANRVHGRFTEDDFGRELREFTKWRRLSGYGPEQDWEKFQVIDLWKKIVSIFTWIFTLYLRTLLLVPLWYLLQMCERRGILETILADKKKFATAVCGWPVFIWLYPSNVVREIRVEAEFRRLGSLFRRFGVAEKALVQKIANSDEYDQWLVAHHRRHHRRFQHGLLVALIATLVVAFAAPAFSSTPVHSGADPPQFQSVGHGEQGSGAENVPNAALPHCPIEVGWVETFTNVWSVEVFTLQDATRRIEHVPLFGSLV
ncbi:hypothetical protein EPO05_02700 [Patescibacteria group bacterium]|nr:MAG: hypothetical protein EPO05_02700 [Patescibacteria group bacterium]